MNTAFFAVGVSFLVVGIATSTTGNGVVWSTFVTLGLVFIALAFAFDRDAGGEDDEPGEADGSAERA
jgi:hypothetical protein